MSETPTSRICRVCKIEKSLENFSRDRRDALGKQRACKECQRTSSNAWQAAHPGYGKEKGRIRYKRSENQARYERYKDDYLQRRRDWRTSIRGRVADLISSAKKRAAKDRVQFELELEWVLNAWEVQGGRCLLTNLPFDLQVGEFNARFYNPFAPSLDKIDPSKGYTKDNTRLVCVIINIGMNRFGEDVFKRMCEAYLQHQKLCSVAQRVERPQQDLAR